MIYKYISNNISNFHRAQNQFGVKNEQILEYFQKKLELKEALYHMFKDVFLCK